MGTAFGKVIDALVTGLPTPLRAIEPTVEVADNWPQTDSGTWVVIGRADPEQGDAGEGDAAYSQLGAGRITESFTVPGMIRTVRDGPNQKTARDAALNLFDGVVKYVTADPTLGGVLASGRVGLVSRVSLQQTSDDDDTGAGGGLLTAEVRFDLAIQNTYVP